MQNPYLSVVATSRNDDHGGNLLYRMQHFVSGFVEQCERHQLHAELILVEWNFLEDQLSLAEQLKFPKSTHCSIRIVRIPKEIHYTWANSDKLPLFQMIAKNVGIRRAKGRFILATNIDILFSDKLMIYLRDRLQPGKLYRVDRLDIPMELPKNGSFQEILKYCRTNYFRINGRYGTKIKFKNKWVLEKKFVKQSPNFLNGFWMKQYLFYKSLFKVIYLTLINKVKEKHFVKQSPNFLNGFWIKQYLFYKSLFKVIYLTLINKVKKKYKDSALHLIIMNYERFLYLSKKIYKSKNGFWMKQYLFYKLILKAIYLVLINKVKEKHKDSSNFLNGFWMKPYMFCKFLLEAIYWVLTNKIKEKHKDSALDLIIKKYERFLYLIKKIYKNKYVHNWHTNACGDFTLLASEDWFKLRGYPEWPIYSWHLDSVFLYQSRSNNIKKKILPKRMSIYHIEHGKGSGYTPEAPELLFKRLEKNGIPYIDYSTYLKVIQQMPKKKKWTYNEENWGLGDIHLEEVLPNQMHPA